MSLFCLLVVKDECGLRIDDSLVSLDGAKALFVDNTIATDYCIVALGDGNLGMGLIGIEDNNDVAPIIAPCVVF